MASLGNFDPSQAYDGYKEVEFLYPACTEFLAKASNVRRYLWSGKDGPFGKEFPVYGAPTPDGTSGFSNFGGRPIYSSSDVPISRINTDGVVKRIRRIADSPPDQYAEGSDELDGEEVEIVPHLVGHKSRTSSSQPLVNRFHSHITPSTPRTFQPTLAAMRTSLPPASPNPSHARPALNQEGRQSPTHNHLSESSTYGQLQQKKRWIFSFTNSCFSSISKKRLEAYPSYQRRSKRAE
ncbi:hypothetical protein O181_026248 [Austropuccinia psidii MF-1]|uniref:Uncharacterized protein n=1 Tax=Austropuccinia psidii MF-1 TaxID=1389203 RepID=A0A9Q3GZU7_9BASI|nr:hypothetical protein [Austropuccinia psidii MF-1]